MSRITQEIVERVFCAALDSDKAGDVSQLRDLLREIETDLLADITSEIARTDMWIAAVRASLEAALEAQKAGKR